MQVQFLLLRVCFHTKRVNNVARCCEEKVFLVADPENILRFNDFKHCINQYIFCTWQDDWNCAVMNKLHSVKPVLGDWQSSYRRCRKDEVVLCRARIGHTHLTHSYILRKDPPPLCEHCQCILTVRHILVECNHFAQERKDIFGIRVVVESFRFHPTLIVLFLKQIELYYKF